MPALPSFEHFGSRSPDLIVEPEPPRREAELVLSALSDPHEWRRLVETYGPVVWAVCERFCPEGERPAAFEGVWQALRKDGGALLRAYDGRARLAAYLHFVAVNELAQWLSQQFTDCAPDALEAFQWVFGKEIRRIVRQTCGDERALAAWGCTSEDLYQEVLTALLDDRCARLRSFDGRGHFTAYVRRIVRNLCLDWLRHERGRLRLPAPVRRLGTLEQEVYRLVSWYGLSGDEVVARLRGRASPDRLQEALALVEEHVPRGHHAGANRRAATLVAQETAQAPTLTPEEELLVVEAQEKRDEWQRLIGEVVDELPSEAQLYIRLRFYEEPPLPPRRIAAVLGRSEEEIYRIRQDVLKRIRRKLTEAGITRDAWRTLLNEKGT